MFKYLKFASLAFIATAGLTFTACNDDDEDDPKPVDPVEEVTPTTENVFTDGVPASFNGGTITTNDKGQVTKVVDGTTVVSFQYGTFTLEGRAHNFTVLMSETDTDSPTSGWDVYMEINKDGFVEYAYQVYRDDTDADEWWFEYNADGQLSRMRRSESGDDFKITYTNGDITKVEMTEDDGDSREYTFNYTNTVANKGCIMLLDDAYKVDIDELEVAYYAGLLGKAAKNLPMGSQRKGVEGDTSYTDDPCVYHWEFNTNQLPVKFWEDDIEYEAVSFTW